MANEVDFYTTVDDNRDNLKVTLKDDQGTAVDLTNASVKFQMAKVGADSLTVDSDEATESMSNATDDTGVDIDSATDGEVTYHWADGDTSEEGYYNARFLVDYSGGTGSGFDSDQSFPNEDYITIKVDAGLP